VLSAENFTENEQFSCCNVPSVPLQSHVQIRTHVYEADGNNRDEIQFMGVCERYWQTGETSLTTVLKK